MAKIIIIDDERAIRGTLQEILEYEKHEVDQAQDGEEAYNKLKDNTFDVAFCDINMPKMDGMTLLEKAMNDGIKTTFIMISAVGTIETAVSATKKGAFDFIQKPPDLNRLLLTLRNALDKTNLVTETKVLKKRVKKGYEIIGKSEAIKDVLKSIEKVAPTDARVLITGSNGTGKELVARNLHDKSQRSSAPLIEVNCAAIPSELIESELFGHEKGAFTSANKRRIGKFEQANNGTLFLDEIGDMSLNAQAKVLRALQDNKISRVGSEKSIKINVRVLAATNKDLKKSIEEKTFREDLYHRLSVILIKVPPLKDRKDDIPLLVDRFMKNIASEYGAKPKSIEPAALNALNKSDWSGNVRELRNVIERLIIMSNDTITAKDVEKYAF